MFLPSMTGPQLRTRRAAAGIPGDVLCKKASIARTRLSGIERGTIASPEEEMKRLFSAVAELDAVRKEVQRVAHRMGWPGAVEIAP